MSTMSRLVKLFPNSASSSSASGGQISYPILVEPAWLWDFLSCRISEVFFKILWSNYSRDNFSRLVKLCPTRCWSSFLPSRRFCSAESQLPQWLVEAEYLSPLPCTFLFNTDFQKKHREIQKNHREIQTCQLQRARILTRAFPKCAQLEYQEVWFGPAILMPVPCIWCSSSWGNYCTKTNNIWCKRVSGEPHKHNQIPV